MFHKPDLQDAPGYSHYFIGLVPENDLMQALANSHKSTLDFIASIPVEKANYRYEEGKWTVSQVLSHIIDCERVYAYRALRFARFDATELASFDVDAYVKNAPSKNMQSQLEEFYRLRLTTIDLFAPMTSAMLDFKGTANKVPFTARGLGFMAVGHNLHHCKVIKERYL